MTTETKPVGTPTQEALRKFIAEDQDAGWDKAWSEPDARHNMALTDT